MLGCSGCPCAKTGDVAGGGMCVGCSCCPGRPVAGGGMGVGCSSTVETDLDLRVLLSILSDKSVMNQDI